MKNYLFLLCGAVCLLVASCTKDEINYPFAVTEKAKPVSGPVIVLPPSGGDDTEALLEALNSASPGSTIQLTAGEYHLRYIEVYGFSGCLRGAGRDKTVISTYGLIDQAAQEALNYLPAWVKFIGGDVTLSDFAFDTGDGSLVTEPDLYYNQTLISLLSVNNYNQVFNSDEHQHMKFRIMNVDFHCGDMDPELSYLNQPYNVLMALWIGSDVFWPLEDIILTAGRYEIINCSVDNAFQGYEAFSLGEDAVLTIDRCSATDCLYGAYFTANYDSKVFISNNTFKTSLEGVLIEDNDWGLIPWVIPFRSVEYTVYGNAFWPGPGSRALTFKDSRGVISPDNYKPVLGIVKNNFLNLTEGSTGISCLNNIGATVKNNRFTGTGTAGVYINGAMVYDVWTGEELGTGESENVLILGNNFNDLEPTEAHIVLGELSKNCTVVGNGKESVIDLGTNNIVVGMKKTEGGYHAGLMIKDNLRMMHGMNR